jgi:hypothetical protein
VEFTAWDMYKEQPSTDDSGAGTGTVGQAFGKTNISWVAALTKIWFFE